MRAFGYIYNTSDERHQFWAIRTERPAQILVLAFKDLFEESYKHKLSLEDDNEQESNQVRFSSLIFFHPLLIKLLMCRYYQQNHLYNLQNHFLMIHGVRIFLQ